MKHFLILILILLIISGCRDHDEHIKIPSEKIKKSDGNYKKNKPASPDTSTNNISSFIPEKKKKKRISESFPSGTTAEIPRHVRDSVRIRKIEWLRKENVLIDMNEPGSRDFLFNGIDDLTEHPFSIVSREQFLKINFDNDILDNTDHFYTNGIRLDFVTPAIGAIPLHYLMMPYRGYGINYYGIALTQNMYTPSTTKQGGILEGDRPYAAYLCLTYYKITNDPARRRRQTSEFMFGVIGPMSAGDFVQSAFHKSVPTNHEPLGWEYQIQNDLVLDYRLSLEKGLVTLPSVDLSITGTGELGTLFTNLSGGFMFRAGLLNPYFSRLWITPRQVNKAMGFSNTEVYFFLKANAVAVGYDATLQGGMFNRSSIYTIPSGDISRFMFNGSAGVTVSMGGIRLDVEQFLISPEFHNGWWHKWVHIGMTVCL